MIDHIVTNKKDNIADCGTIPCGISDHEPVHVIKHARLPKIKKDPKIITVRSMTNLNNDTLIKDLNELPVELMRASAANELWSSWKPFFLDILNKHVPYVTAEVKSMMRQRDYLRGKANKRGLWNLLIYFRCQQFPSADKKLFKVQMKCFFIADFKRAAKIRKIAIYHFLMSLLVPEFIKV